MKIGFLGPNGSFSHNVALSAFPTGDLQAFETITEVIKAFESEQVAYAIVPVENAIEGSVHETVDYLFHQAHIQVVAEVIQPIAQQLMVSRPDQIIEKIFSHPQAIAQGKKFITEHYPQASIELTASTAYAAQFVAAHPELPYAAIAPVTAAETYGLTIIGRDIQELSQNYTRFWIVGRSVPVLPLVAKEHKISLALTLPDNQPGSLYQALSVFAWRKIDLTKLESRPLKTALGEYFFLLDAHQAPGQVLDYTLEELTSLGISYKILGDYTVYTREE